MKMVDEQLLKCLECRLVGSPPKFDLPPPPPPPPAFIDALADSNTGDQAAIELLNNLNSNQNRNKFLRRCLRFKNFLADSQKVSVNTQIHQAASHSSSETSKEAAELSDYWKLFTSTESLYIFFFICSIVFLIVLIVALVFLIKLFKIKKQLHKNASDSQIHKTFSSSLTNSTTASSVSSSNTMSSQILSLKQETDSQSSQSSQFYNQLFTSVNNQHRVHNQYLQSMPVSKADSDEYQEIGSQAYEKTYLASNHYNNYDSAYLEKLKLSCINMGASGLPQQLTNSSAFLIPNNSNGLMLLNQLKQFSANECLASQQSQKNLVQPNVYYVC